MTCQCFSICSPFDSWNGHLQDKETREISAAGEKGGNYLVWVAGVWVSSVNVCVSYRGVVIESHPNSVGVCSVHRGVKWSGPGVDYKPGLHYNRGEKQQGSKLQL